MYEEMITKQELIDAQVDAKDLEKIINDAPEIQVQTRLGRYVWTLSTIEQRSLSKINEWQNAINTIVVNDGVPALAVSNANGKTQQEINDFGGAEWWDKPGGYKLGATVNLESGDIVKSTTPNNTANPNIDMTGWINPIAEQSAVNEKILTRIAHVKDFGAIGDGTSHPLSSKFTTLAEAQVVYPFATSLTQEIDMCAFQKMVNTFPTNAVLHFTGMNLYAGSFNRASPRVWINNPLNLQLIGNGCLTTGTTADQRAVCYAVKNPNNFKALDFEFTDPNFDVNDTTGGNRAGYYGFAFCADAVYSSANPCGNIEITGKVTNSLAFAITEGTTALGITTAANYNAIKTVKSNYIAKNAYYGFSTIYGSTHNDAKGDCNNVKRGFISYGTNNSDIDLTLKCDAGFVGSNAFVEIAQEGASVPSAHDITAKVHVSGVEAHTRYISLYHQQPESDGLIYNIDGFIFFDNLTTDGKNPLTASTNGFAIVWHDGTAEQSITNRKVDNIKLDCLMKGSISGRPFFLGSVPNDKTGRMYFGNGLCEALAKDYVTLAHWSNFRVLGGSISVPFLTPPAISGSTSAGVATYSTQKGIVSIRDAQAFYNVDLVWTGHTGTGFAIVSGMPVKAQSNTSVGQTTVSLQDTGFTGVISALVAGAGLNQLILYSKDTATGLNPRANLPAAGAFKASFNFSLYN